MRLINHSLGDGLLVLSQTSHHPSKFFFYQWKHDVSIITGDE